MDYWEERGLNAITSVLIIGKKKRDLRHTEEKVMGPRSREWSDAATGSCKRKERILI